MIHSNQKGFTIVELLIVIIITGIISGLLIMVVVQFTRGGADLTSSNTVFVERLTASDRLRSTLSTSSGTLIQTSINDPNALAPDSMNSTLWKKIHAVPKLYGTNNTITPLLYYQSYAYNSSKNIIFNGVNPYTNQYVLYHDGTTKELRLRTLTNTAAPGNTAKTSCQKALATAACPEDRLLLEDVTGVNMSYFSRSGNAIDFTSSSENPAPGTIDDPVVRQCQPANDYLYCNGFDFAQVEVVQLEIKLAKKVDGNANNTTQSTTIIRIAIRNV